MKVAVILPVYKPNHKWLSEAIESVLSQKTTHDITLYVRFDGDDTGFIMPDDKRIVIIKDKYRRGLSGGLNFMINHIIATSWGSRFDYFARIDADDKWHFNKTEKQIKYAQENKLGVCGVWGILVNKSGNEDWDWKQGSNHLDIDAMYRADTYKNYFVDPSAIIDAKLVYDGLIHYNNAMLGGADRELWLRLATMKVPMASLPERLYFYRWYGDGQNTHATQCIKTMDACCDPMCQMYRNLSESMEYYVPTQDYFRSDL